MIHRFVAMFMLPIVVFLSTLATPAPAAGTVPAAGASSNSAGSLPQAEHQLVPPRIAAPAQAQTRCLSGDRYNLARLAKIVGSPNPPTKPVTIGRNLKVQFVRAGNMVDHDAVELPRGRSVNGTPAPSEPRLERSAFDEAPIRIFNTRTKLEFRVTMSDAMLRNLYTCHERTGRTEAGGPAEPGVVEGRRSAGVTQVVGPNQSAARPFEQVITAGWSDGSDTRILRTPTTKWPWRTITQSSYDDEDDQSRCTMTLIGPRHLITAAHCLVNFGTSNWKTRQLAPGRDGLGVLPYGASQMTTSPPPGVEAWYLVPDPWIDPSTPDTIDKYQWDIGLVLMVDRLGEQTGWMGYGAYTAGDLNTRDHYNRGYPGCQSTYSERPAGCQAARLYGDTAECEIDDYHHPGSNGWNRQFSFGCDISRGHSGSPIYHYRNSATTGQLVPVVIAVVSWHECLQCDEDQPGVDEAFPNHARRLTPWVLGQVSWLREQFP